MLTLDKTSVIFGISIGIIIGFIVAGIFIIIGVSDIMSHIQVQSVAVNTSVNFPMNETRLVEAINQTRQ